MSTVQDDRSRSALVRPEFDLPKARADFPILATRVHGHPLVYLDNAATTQKPRCVIDAVRHYYEAENANIHRGVHYLSQLATEKYEAARETVRKFLNAKDVREVIYVRGATEGINLVAQSWGRANVRSGDEIVVSALEHHANIVPWQMLCGATGATLRVIPMRDSGELILDGLDGVITSRTKLVAVGHVSNALGTVNDLPRIIAAARHHGACVLVDGAQAVAHIPVDVQALDADFYVFSGHKLYAPTGIGILYGKRALLESMPPWQGGGDMIRSVSFEHTEFNELPHKFEAGTPHISGAIGLGVAIEYLQSLGLPRAAAWEAELLRDATAQLSALPGVRVVGTASHKASVLSFTIDGIHPHDIGTILDDRGVAIRAGHHCAQPVMTRLGIPATARASFAFYNARSDVDALAAAVTKAIEVFG